MRSLASSPSILRLAAVSLACMLLCVPALAKPQLPPDQCADSTAGESVPNDYAAEVILYAPGDGIPGDWLTGDRFDDPETALGRPTVDTTGDGWYIPFNESCPVVHVYPAFRYYEMVCLGFGGTLVVKFDHPVENDPYNPYGIDFVVFGNAFQIIDGLNGWTNGDPEQCTVGIPGMGFAEPGTVSVSQDGSQWYTFSLGPRCDDFAPTMGRVLNEAYEPLDSGSSSTYWSVPTDPTFPVDPELSWTSFGGWSVADMAREYGRSAGGTGYDLDWLIETEGVTLEWIQYVRVESLAEGVTSEIDALSDVAPIPPPVIISIIHESQGTTITWEGDPDINYTVQWSSDMETWQEEKVGKTTTWTDTAVPGGMKFYRVY